MRRRRSRGDVARILGDGRSGLEAPLAGAKGVQWSHSAPRRVNGVVGGLLDARWMVGEWKCREVDIGDGVNAGDFQSRDN